MVEGKDEWPGGFTWPMFECPVCTGDCPVVADERESGGTPVLN